MKTVDPHSRTLASAGYRPLDGIDRRPIATQVGPRRPPPVPGPCTRVGGSGRLSRLCAKTCRGLNRPVAFRSSLNRQAFRPNDEILKMRPVRNAPIMAPPSAVRERFALFARHVSVEQAPRCLDSSSRRAGAAGAFRALAGKSRKYPRGGKALATHRPVAGERVLARTARALPARGRQRAHGAAGSRIRRSPPRS